MDSANITEIRIHKWFSQIGLASRREAEKWIAQGRVCVNGTVVCQLGVRFRPGIDSISLDGKKIGDDIAPPKVYWLLNKPAGVLTSRKSEEGKDTIFDLPKLKNIPFIVNPVGRLDYMTEGLLLLSNDGELVNRLTHPAYKVPRYYHVLVNGKLTVQMLDQMKQGVTLEDGPTKGIDIKFLEGKNLGGSKGALYYVTVYEGRNRLVRRLFEIFGLKVLRLVRTGFGDITLPEYLAAGDYRQLSHDEIFKLRRTITNRIRRHEINSSRTSSCVKGGRN